MSLSSPSMVGRIGASRPYRQQVARGRKARDEIAGHPRHIPGCKSPEFRSRICQVGKLFVWIYDIYIPRKGRKPL